MTLDEFLHYCELGKRVNSQDELDRIMQDPKFAKAAQMALMIQKMADQNKFRGE